MPAALEIRNLSVAFNQNSTSALAIDNISLRIEKAKLTAIVGESGSGKSVTALSILQLLPPKTSVRGTISFLPENDDGMDLLKLSNKQISKIRGKRISMIFQEPMTSLNPVRTCGSQVIEVLRQHERLSNCAAKKRAIELFAEVGLGQSSDIVHRYPHQLSGGQKQRVMIAMAISCRPDVLIADEPTTALDVRIQKNILSLLKQLQIQNNMSVLLITHDLALVKDVADEVIVMYKGTIVETGPTSEVLNNPHHPYTRALLACRPAGTSKGKRLPVIGDYMIADTPVEMPSKITSYKAETKNVPILSVQNLTVHFRSSHSLFRKDTPAFKAVDDVSFDVMENETIGVVGESGSGKTTLGRSILQLIKPTSGKIILDGKDICKLEHQEFRKLRKDLQIVFQDPYGSLNPRITIGEAVLEPMKVHQLYTSNAERKEKVISLLEQVQLSGEYFGRYPHQFSGGQRQRICIARALALNPSFLIFDESVSALDVSVQAQVLNLINDLKSLHNFTSIFISHDLSVVHYISDRILVMNHGKIVEQGTADDVYNSPAHEYTQQLMAAIPGRIYN